MNYDVKFIPNTSDNLHCLQAAWLMVILYFKPDFSMGWEKFSKITGFEIDKGTWAIAGLLWMKTQGFEVKHITPFDYEAFAQKGSEYLVSEFGQEVGSWQVAHSNILLEQKRSKELIASGLWENRVPTIEDIETYLRDGYLATCLINAMKLDNLGGYSGHAVVVKGFDDEYLYLHDPGLPPSPNKKVTRESFEKAWADPNPESKEMSIIKLKA